MLRKHIAAFLICVMVLTSGGLTAFAEVADTDAAGVPESAAVNPEAVQESSSAGDEAVTDSGSADTDSITDSNDEEKSDTDRSAETSSEMDPAAAPDNLIQPETDGTDGEAQEVELLPEDAGDVPEIPETPAVIDSFAVAENTAGSVTFTWEPVEAADRYIIYLDYEGYLCEEPDTYTFTGLDGIHKFRIEALDAEGTVTACSEELRIMTFSEALRPKLTNRTISSPKSLGINLRTLINEPYNGYSVVQGGCTDGTYAYYLMVSTSTQKGRVLKVRISDKKVIKTSGVLNTHHGNGMTYDSKRKVLVVVAREERKQELTVIDAATLKVRKQQNVKYSYYKNATSGSITKNHQERGLAAIAYSPRYDVYLALQRNYHNILIFDPDTFEAVGIVFTRITADYPGVYQAMDADDRYVYLLLSYYDKTQPYNVIVTLDWNSENLLDVVNGNKKFIEKAWRCDNRGEGKPDAAIRINTKHEAENIYHVADASGKSHFYLSEYYNNPVYKTITQKVKYKVKWKKVTRKVKWKKVKKNGKWKWKYKKKKVWKYKTKYKKVKKTVVSYYNRANYVYDLGTF